MSQSNSRHFIKQFVRVYELLCSKDSENVVSCFNKSFILKKTNKPVSGIKHRSIKYRHCGIGKDQE